MRFSGLMPIGRPHPIKYQPLGWQSGSSDAGCTAPFVSIARWMILCSAALAACHVNGALLLSSFAFCHEPLSPQAIPSTW